MLDRFGFETLKAMPFFSRYNIGYQSCTWI